MWNDLSSAEVHLSDEAITALRSVPWAAQLLARLDTSKQTKDQDRALLFEIRFAYSLYQAGHVAQYEYAGGVGTSTIDFRVVTRDYEWLIELVSLFESDAVKGATEQIGPFQKLVLHNALGFDDPASEAGEMIKAEEKIGEKVFTRGSPTKFSEPSNAIHVIATDMRGYLGIGAHVIDNDDYRQIAYGPAGIPDHHVQWWGGNPVKGLFQKDNPTRAAKYARERVHILAFICEREYAPTEICSAVLCAPNPTLFPSTEQIRAVLNQCPVRVGSLCDNPK